MCHHATPEDFVVLPEIISKEPLGPMVRHGDNQFTDIVRWAQYAMIEAEEYGITSKNVDEMLKSENPTIKRIFWLWLAQFLGAMCGSSVMALYFAPHWTHTPDPRAKLGIFCTAPAIYKPWANLVSEIIGTMVLVIVAGAIFSPGVAEKGPVAGIGPWLVGSLVWGIGLSLGGTTGYAINPARDLGPRIVHALLPIPGKGDSNWGYAPIPVVGPIVGATLAGLFLRFAHPW